MRSKICLNIKGKDIIKFIKRLNSNNIELLDIKYLEKDVANIKIYKSDYNHVIELKTIYEIEEIGYDGLLKVKKIINLNKFIIVFIVLGISAVIFLSNVVFEIEIITNDFNMEKKILDELNNNGLKKYGFKKNYDDLQKIKNNILEKYKAEIDWLEIENVGTKYIIRYEPRIENPKKEITSLRHIIASKDAIIYSLDVSSGQIIKNKKSYVKKGDIIVSGYIYLNDQIKDTVSANGNVFGEVWYEVMVTYPLKYKEEKMTGKSKNVYVLKILNKNIELFNIKHYKSKKVTSNTILKSNILPFSLEKQYQEEIDVIDENNTVDQAIEKAVDLGNEKIKENLEENEFIIEYKILNQINDEDSVTVKIFYSVCENITEYQEIKEFTELEDNNENADGNI